MKITGTSTIPYPVEKVWDALLDPAVLVRTIPGCERLQTTGEHTYDMTVTVGVAAIRGTYTGTCEMSDLAPHSSLVMRVQGAGAPGTVGATVDVSFQEVADGTEVVWDADAVVGGMIGGVGQRMLSSVSRRMAAEMFDGVGRVLSGATAPAGADPGSPEGVYTAPARTGSRDDFVRGTVVGAGLVLLGVAAGAVFGRRR